MNTHRGSHQSRQLEILQDVLEWPPCQKMIIIEQSKKKSREMGGAYHMLCCYDYVDFGIKFQDEMMIPHTNFGVWVK